MDDLQAANECDLCGRPDTRVEAVGPHTCGRRVTKHTTAGTLEDTVEDRKKVDQVWNAFEKSFEQSTSFWHFRDAYLADFRQDKLETMADLDLYQADCQGVPMEEGN